MNIFMRSWNFITYFGNPWPGFSLITFLTAVRLNGIWKFRVQEAAYQHPTMEAHPDSAPE